MPYILAGFFVVLLALYGIRSFVRANPASLVQLLHRATAAASLALALFLGLRGQIEFAVVLGLLGFWLTAAARKTGAAGRKPKQLAGESSSRGDARGARLSRVRSAVIEMELDQTTGAISGTILAGQDEGKPLARLSRSQCEALYRLCLREDPEGARLLEMYLDRRFPGWSAARDDEPDSWGSRPAVAPRFGAMTEDEAYEVLGLQKGATRDDVVRSHRSLIKKLHPDQGGSADLSARVNEAKDVLMRRHH